MATTKYNPYNAVKSISDLKGKYHTAKELGQDYNQYATQATQYYNELRNNGYGDVADELTANDYIGSLDILSRYKAFFDEFTKPDNGSSLDNAIAAFRSGYLAAADKAAEENYAEKLETETAEKYKESASKPVVKAIADTVSSANTMLPAAAVSAATGGVGGAAVMGLQSMPDSYISARNSGATQDQALGYSALEALNNSVGEMLIGGFLGKGAGLLGKGLNTVTKGASGRFISSAMNSLAKSPLGKTALSTVSKAAGEGAEEVAQGLISTINERLTYNPDAKVDVGDLAYEGLIGSLMGGAFQIAGVPAQYQAYRSDYDTVNGFSLASEAVRSENDVQMLRQIGDSIIKQADELISDKNSDTDTVQRTTYIKNGIRTSLDLLEKNSESIISGNANKAAALETAISSTPENAKENIVSLVRTVAADGKSANRINKTIDFVRGEIQNAKNEAATAVDENTRRQANENLVNYQEIDRALRSYRKEISAELDSSTASEVDAETNTSEIAQQSSPESTEEAQTANLRETESSPSVENNADTDAEEAVTVDEFDSAKTASFERSNISDSLDIDLTGNAEQDAESLLDSRRGVRGAIDQLTKTANEIRSSGSESAESDIAYIRELDRAVREKNRAYTQKKANAYAAVLKQWGIKNVVVDDSLAYNYSGDDVRANGYYDRSSGEIHLSPYLSEDAAVGSIVVHEFTHRGAAADSSLVDSLLEAKNKMESAGVYKGPDRSAYLNAYSDLLNGMSESDSEAYINEEIAAHFMQDIMENENVLEALAREDRTLLQRILDFIADLIAPSDKENRAARRAADKIRAVLEKSETAKSAGVEVAQRVEGADAKNNIGKIKESIPSSAKIIAAVGSTALDSMLSDNSIADSSGNVNSETEDVTQSQQYNPDIRFSRVMDDTTITNADVEALRDIPRKSVNKFTSEDIQKTEKWARKFYNELDVRSPFFRAWFGDWRANQQDTVKVIDTANQQRGTTQNKDTGWNIIVSRQITKETTHQNSKSVKDAVKYLPYINDITENAVLLNSEISDKDNDLSIMFHSLYCYTEAEGYPAVLKLRVEELIDEKSGSPIRRDYILQSIKEEPVADNKRFSKAHQSETGSSEISIADLFDLVKTYDEEFEPIESSKVVNKDGAPKIMYHGSPNEFTVFDKKKSKPSNLYGRGFYFSDSDAHAKTYGKPYEVYLDVKNPLTPNGTAITEDQIRAFLEAVAENEDDYSIENYGTYDVDEILDGITSRDAFAVIQDINATAIGDFAEAIELFNEVNGTEFDGIITNTETVVFKPEQIKSATDNIGTFDRNNPDIRFSRVMETEEQRELRRKQERIEYLEKQHRSHTALGWAKAVSPAERRKFASKIASGMPGVTVDEVSAGLKEVWDIFEAAKKDSSDTADARFKAAYEKAHEVAVRLVENASANEINPLYEQYNDLRNRLRTVPVKMTISRGEFGGDEDYRRWRRGNVGLLRISDSADAIPVDTFYQELSAQYPEFFPPEVENEADQLKRLGDAAVELRRIAGSQTEKVNPLEDIAESFAADLTNQILFGFDQLAKTTEGARREYGRMMNENDVRQAYAEGASEAAYREQTAYETGVKEGRTYNEKEVQAAAEREEIQRQIFERDFRAAQANFSNEIERQNNRIASLENRISRKSENNRLTMARKSTLAALNRLNTMLTKPNRSKHIPQNLRAPVARLLETLGTTRLPNGKTVNAETMRDIQESEYARFEAECARAVDDMRTSINSNRVSENNSLSDQFIDKLTDNIERLKEIYAEINPASPDDAVLPPDLMTSRRTDYVRQVGRILGMVEHYVKDANVVFLNDKAVSAREFSEKMISELRQKKRRVQETGKASQLRERMSGMGYEFVSADLFFEMMGDSGVELMHEYRRGQTLQAQHEDEFTQYMLKATGGKYSTHNAGFSGDLISLSIDGKGLKVTKGQLMQLYLTWKRPAGRRHLMTGGAVFTNEVGQESKANTVRITQDIYDDLVAHLSEKDIAVCDAIGKFLSKRCAEWGNEASMKMYGYRMFEDPNYFPLDVSKHALSQDWDSIDEFYLLENAGMTKSLKSDASAPLRMTDVFDVADFHVRTMAAYGAFAPISNDVQRIMNMPGVAEAVDYGMGGKGTAYLNKLVKTIASNKVRTGDISDAAAPLSFFMNAYKRQAVSFNISTALKQPLSIVRALNEIEGKYIRKAPLVMSNTEYKRIYDTMVENSGVAKMKMLGYSDTGFGKSMRQIYDTDYVNESGIIRGTLSKSKGGRTAVKAYDKITDAGMWMAGKADEMTWVRIWKACELEVADKYKGLEL